MARNKISVNYYDTNSYNTARLSSCTVNNLLIPFRLT